MTSRGNHVLTLLFENVLAGDVRKSLSGVFGLCNPHDFGVSSLTQMYYEWNGTLTVCEEKAGKLIDILPAVCITKLYITELIPSVVREYR